MHNAHREARPRKPVARSLPLRPDPAQVLTRDYGRLLRQWRDVSRPKRGDRQALAKLEQAIEASKARRAARAQSIPRVRLDEALPISARADDIIGAIGEHQVLVLAGETGSGKTTQLPKLCLAAGRGASGMVGCTQPRRLAARSMARRVAEEMGTELGDKVGFQVRFTDRVGEASLVKFMTDGILLAETRRDRWLSAYDTLIIDEAHERSLNIDFLLGYLKRLARKRPELKIIVTSATIDTARFAEHFDNAPVIEVEGRAWPVEVRWRPLGDADGKDMRQGSAQHIARAVDEITAEDPRGDVLVFLPGEREIRDTHRLLARRGYRHTEVMPLYARLSAAEQDRVFKPGPARRVVLATNVAETSLTVPRIRYVIDTGSARVKRYSQRSQIERLHVEPISQAAADQRKGRCGRVGSGVCVRLFDEADFDARPRFTEPELLRSSLANVILRMLDLGLGEVERFPFLDAPEPRAIADGYRRLAELQAVDGEQRLTAIGRELARYPIDAQLARMLIEGDKLDVLPALRTLVAFLGVQDPRERPPDARGQADAAHREFADDKSDFLGVLKLWQAFDGAHQELTQRKLRDWCGKHFLNYMRMREWREVHRQLRLLGGPHEGKAPPDADPLGAEHYQPIHMALLAGLPTQVGRKHEDGEFRGTRQRRFRVFPGSSLAKKPPDWVFAAQILDLGGRVWGMLCAHIKPAWVEQQAAHLLRCASSEPHWSRKRGKVVAFEQVSLFGLVLVERRTVTFQSQDPALAHAIFLQQALARCDIDTRADFIKANRKVLDQAHDREARERRQGLLRDDAELAGFFQGKLPASVSSRVALEKWYRKAPPAAQAALRWSLDDVLEVASGLKPGDFPSQLDINGQLLQLAYRFVPGDPADGVTLTLPLALLNAIPVARCQWLVPGMLADKVVALIRSLPKKLRRNFVPAPDFARAFVEAASPSDLPLAESLATFLKRTTGSDIQADAFADAEIPEHLRMRFCLLDGEGAVLATSRSLGILRENCGGKARQAFSRQANTGFDQAPSRQWNYGELPEKIDPGHGLDAWPALVDLGEAVAVRAFESPDKALAEHRRGVERLLRLALAAAIKQARRKLPVQAETGLKAVSLIGMDALRADLVEGGLRDLLASASLDLRSEAEFKALHGRIERGLFAAAIERFKLAEAIIEAHADLRPWLEPPMMGFARASYDDLKEQLQHLLAEGFARELALPRLAQLPRYLKAMRLRGERLRQDPGKDQQRMLQVLPHWRECLKLSAEGGDAGSCEVLRWMIEEYRVSLFAQELGTHGKVSPKRLKRALDHIQG